MLYLKHKLNPVPQVKAFWDSLDENAIVNKRELVLGLSTVFLSGMVIGMLVSPRKNMTIGSHNGCNNGPANSTPVEAPEGEE